VKEKIQKNGLPGGKPPRVARLERNRGRKAVGRRKEDEKTLGISTDTLQPAEGKERPQKRRGERKATFVENYTLFRIRPLKRAALEREV